MPSVAETFKQELLARLVAGPLTDYGPDAPLAKNIRRSHLTVVPREEAPSIYLRFGRARPVADKSCQWRWELDWTVSVYLRSDNDEDADPLVIAAVNRVNPSNGTPYTNAVRVELTEVDAETEIADEDAQRVDIKGVAKFGTAEWALTA